MVHEKTNCPRCQRRIDAVARICPFCNFENRLVRDDAQATIPLPSIPAQTTPRSQPESTLRERLLGNPVILGLGIALMLVSAFAVGALVNLFGSRGRVARAEEEKPAAAASQQERDPLANLNLVPVTSAPAGTGVVTSAPMPNISATLPFEAQRADATALPSAEYSKVLAQSARPAQQDVASVDPRSLPPGLGVLQKPPRAPERSPEDATPEAPSETEETAESDDARTSPVPVRQPIPRFENLEQSGSVRLRLTVDERGRVTEVEVVQGLRGATGEVVDAVRGWRFKPATRNGEPVQGTFDAEIFFNGQR